MKINIKKILIFSISVVLFAILAYIFLISNGMLSDQILYYKLKSAASHNSKYIEYHEFNDFDDLPEIQYLMDEEPREFDYQNLTFSIGNETYPLNAKLSELSDDFKIVFTNTKEKKFIDNYDKCEYYQRHSLLFYRDYYLGYVSFIRHEDETTDDYRISSILLTDRQKIPIPIGFMDFSINSSVTNIAEKYIPDEIIYDDKDNSINFLRYDKRFMLEDKEYTLYMLVSSNGSLIISIHPSEANPEISDE